MTAVKICGITCMEDVEILNKYRPDYAGFVLYEPSKRYVSLAQAIALKQALEADIHTVAVTVNPDDALIQEIVQAGFDTIQIHKCEHMERIQSIPISVWMAFQVSEARGFALPDLPDNVTGILLDAAGYGSGQSFDWQSFPKDLLAQCRTRKFILAGGLTAKNVKAGIQLFAPDIVDVSSSVEGETGKDAKKTELFIRKVREDE